MKNVSYTTYYSENMKMHTLCQRKKKENEPNIHKWVLIEYIKINAYDRLLMHKDFFF